MNPNTANAVARKACEIANRLYPGTRWLPGDAAGLETLPPAGEVERHVSPPDDLHAVGDGKVPPAARGGADEDGLDAAA